MEGTPVFKFAVKTMGKASLKVLKKAGVKKQLEKLEEEIFELNPNLYGIGVRLRPLTKWMGKILKLEKK